MPQLNGGELGGGGPTRAEKLQHAGVVDGKVKEVKELGLGIKKRKLTEAVEQLVAEGGHHVVDALRRRRLRGLELRPVDDGQCRHIVNEADYEADD